MISKDFDILVIVKFTHFDDFFSRERCVVSHYITKILSTSITGTNYNIVHRTSYCLFYNFYHFKRD
jgi:hypothetical protein